MIRRFAAPVFAAAVFFIVLNACGASLADDENRTAFDPDLYSWKTASWSPFTVNDSISGFAYGKPGGWERYIAAAKTGVIAWSNDGDIWHLAEKYIPLTIPPTDPATVPDPFAVSFNAAAFGGGIFIAAGNSGKIAYSSDGIHWTAGPSAGITGFGSENIMGIAFGNGLFVAVGGNANIAYSSDGITWTACRDAAFGTSRLNDIAFDGGGGRFYIGGDDGKRGWSDNPASGNWNFKAPVAPFNSNAIRKITVGRYGSGIGIGVVFDEWGGKRMVISRSADFNGGADFDADLDASQFGNNVINGIAFGGGYFAAAGQSAMIGWWPSAEPSNASERYWRALSFTEFQWWEITALAALKDRFFLGGTGGKIGYSK